MIRTLKGIRNALRRFASKAEPTGEIDLKLDPAEIIASQPSPRRTPPPIAPKGFDPEAFFKGITWYQKWEVFDGIFTPGINLTSLVCDLMQLPADLSGRRILDIGSANGCMSLECERRGAAEVIGLTPLNGLDWGHHQLRDAVGAT